MEALNTRKAQWSNDLKWIGYDDPEYILWARDYLEKLLDSEVIFGKDDIKWLAKYVLNEQCEKLYINIKLSPLTFIEYVDYDGIKKRTYKLLKEKGIEYRGSFGGCLKFGNYIFNNNTYDYEIRMHIGLFRICFKQNGFNQGINTLTVTCFHELKHVVRDEKLLPPLSLNRRASLDEYILRKEIFLSKFDAKFYQKFHDDFLDEITADIYGYTMALEFFQQHSPKLYELLKDYNTEKIHNLENKLNMYNCHLANTGIHNVLKKDCALLKYNPLLLHEYNLDGTPKSLLDIVRISIDEKQNILLEDEVFMNIIVEHLFNMDEKEYDLSIINFRNEEIRQLCKAINWSKGNIMQKKEKSDIHFKQNIIDNDTYIYNTKVLNYYLDILERLHNVAINKNKSDYLENETKK